ncbi:MAG: hypothetical protein HGB12_09675 [Bacteroidetes bacterium]|nr:hypothetical protein [Bacteroidota bacterium]
MKKISIFLFAFCTFNFQLLNFNSFAQGVSINTTGNEANNSAMLDVSSTNHGMLIPRVSLTSTTDITTIASPASSLLVYNTNGGIAGGIGFYYNAGTTTSASWTQLLAGNAVTNIATGTGLTGGPIIGTGTISLSTPVSVANGGTAGSATPTAGAVAYGNGTTYAFTAAGTSGQVLTSQEAAAPIWTTPLSADASETVKGIVEEATNAEVTAGAATGATGAKLFVTPEKFNLYKSKIYINATGVSTTSATYQTAFSLAIPGGTLGTNSCIRFFIPIKQTQVNGGGTSVKISYGSQTLWDATTFTSISSASCMVTGFIIANNSTSAQKSEVMSNRITNINITDLTVDSTISQNLIVQIKSSNASYLDAIEAVSIIVENLK